MRAVRTAVVAAVAATTAAALTASAALIATGLAVHRENAELGRPRLVGGAIVLLATLVAAGVARRCGARALVGPLVVAAVYAPLALIADRPQFDARGTVADDPLVARHEPILLLDSGERDRAPWLVAATVTRDGRRVAIDYWWAFATNRAPAAADAICLPWLAVSRRTCFDHDGDLEGATVLLDGDAITGLRLAAHTDVLEVAVAEATFEAGRPLVFVARGSHATYAHACRAECRRSDRRFGIVPVAEGPHDGRVRVELARTAALPVRRQCLLPALCIRGDAPPPIVTQARFRNPLGAHLEVP